MTVHRDKFLVNKTTRRTEFHIYWYYDSTCFGQPFRPSSGVRSRTSALIHFMQFWWPFDTRTRMELRSILLLPGAGWNRFPSFCWQKQDGTQFHPAPGSKRLSKLHKMYQCRCTATNSWWWEERLPETCRVVIPINLEFSASVGFIHKELVQNLHTFYQSRMITTMFDAPYPEKYKPTLQIHIWFHQYLLYY